MKKRGIVTGVMAGTLALSLAACSSSSSTSNSSGSIETLKIASQNYTEAQIDDYLLADLIQAKTKINVEVTKTAGVSGLIHSLLKKGNVQLYVSYDGTEFMEQYKKSYTGEFAGNPDKVYDYVKEQEAKDGIWVSPKLGYQDTYGVTVKAETAQKYNLKKVSDLSSVAKNMVLGTDTTFPNQEPVGLKGLEGAYNFKFKDAKPMDYNLIFPALDSNAVQATVSYSTDGRLKKMNQVILEDDKSFFPPYFGVVLIDEKARKAAKLDEVLSSLWGAISLEDQTQMNYDVDVLKKDPKQVAHDFLVKKNLIK